MKLQLLVHLLLLTWPANLCASMIHVSPASTSAVLGSTFTLEVHAGGLVDGAAPSIGVFDITVSYSADFMSFSLIEWGSGLDVLGLGTIRAVSSALGNVTAFELSLDSADELNALQPDAFPLFTLTFVATQVGTAPISIAIRSLGDAQGLDLPVSTVGGTVVISDGASVPEPATIFSCVGVLFLLVLLKRLGRLGVVR